jgi:hypothetical protein
LNSGCLFYSQVSGLSLPEQFALVNAPIDPFDPKQQQATLSTLSLSTRLLLQTAHNQHS